MKMKGNWISCFYRFCLFLVWCDFQIVDLLQTQFLSFDLFELAVFLSGWVMRRRFCRFALDFQELVIVVGVFFLCELWASLTVSIERLSTARHLAFQVKPGESNTSESITHNFPLNAQRTRISTAYHHYRSLLSYQMALLNSFTINSHRIVEWIFHEK